MQLLSIVKPDSHFCRDLTALSITFLGQPCVPVWGSRMVSSFGLVFSVQPSSSPQGYLQYNPWVLAAPGSYGVPYIPRFLPCESGQAYGQGSQPQPQSGYAYPWGYSPPSGLYAHIFSPPPIYPGILGDRPLPQVRQVVRCHPLLQPKTPLRSLQPRRF